MSKPDVPIKRVCCLLEENIREVDGFLVCVNCGTCKGDTVFNDAACYHAYSENQSDLIYDICENGGISQRTRDIAWQLFLEWSKRIPKCDLMTLKATTIYVACQIDENPRSLKEISSISGICSKQIGKYDAIINTKNIVVEPEMYIHRFCRKLGKDFDFLKKAQSKLQQISLKSKATPITEAALSIYLVCLDENSKDRKICQAIQETTGVSTSTLNRLLKLTKFTPPPNMK